ncbi:MAG: hypothetical protein PQJ35_01950 [Sphaerochaetaceae bacterium]|nr:hypothetical protein [Sphaerochaetaceae bacterium]
MKLVTSSQLVFQGSADTQIFLINEKEQSFLISLSGFLNSTDDQLENFRCSEIILYTGANVKNIIDTTMKRSSENTITEHHSFRQFDLTPKLKELIVDWMFSAEMLQSLD